MDNPRGRQAAPEDRVFWDGAVQSDYLSLLTPAVLGRPRHPTGGLRQSWRLPSTKALRRWYGSMPAEDDEPEESPTGVGDDGWAGPPAHLDGTVLDTE